MTREEQIYWLCRLRADLNNGVIFTPWKKEFTEALNDVLEQEPKEITLEDVKGYCKPRLLTIITIELYNELIHSKIKAREQQELVIDKIRAEIEKAVWEDVVVSLDGTDEVRIPRLDPGDVFEIIDKYKADKEL